MPRRGVAETFNCGIGYVWIGPPYEVDRVVEIARMTPVDGEEGKFYEPHKLGKVEDGKAGTYFALWDLELPPPGEK